MDSGFSNALSPASKSGVTPGRDASLVSASDAGNLSTRLAGHYRTDAGTVVTPCLKQSADCPHSLSAHVHFLRLFARRTKNICRIACHLSVFKPLLRELLLALSAEEKSVFASTPSCLVRPCCSSRGRSSFAVRPCRNPSKIGKYEAVAEIRPQPNSLND